MGQDKLYLKSFAKINLYLDIGKKFENGYHEIETIFQTINLFDEICLEKIDEPVLRVYCNHPEVPIGKDSMLCRAVNAIMKEGGIKRKGRGLTISIKKKIPLASGLGGGSSNIATILLGIAQLFDIKMDSSQLRELAVRFGMDIPYFIHRGTVYARGRGEELFPLISIDPPFDLILVNPGMKISTQWAYHIIDQEQENSDPKNVDIVPFLNQKRKIRFGEMGYIIYNRFNSTISKYYPVISKIRNELQDLGIGYSSLSGSGPTVFGIVENEQKRDEVFFKIKDHYPFICRTSTVRAEKIVQENHEQVYKG